jgi:hypothetical protein
MMKNDFRIFRKKFKDNRRGIKINNNPVVSSETSIGGITLIALVITIIVLLILARSKYSNTNRR